MNNTEEEFYRQKYLKYKAKYLEAKENIKGGERGPYGFECSKTLMRNTQDQLGCKSTPGCEWKTNELKTGELKPDELKGECKPIPCSSYAGVFETSCNKVPGCEVDTKYWHKPYRCVDNEKF